MSQLPSDDKIDPAVYATMLIDTHEELEKILHAQTTDLMEAFWKAKRRLNKHRKTGVGETEAVALLTTTKKAFDNFKKTMASIEIEYKKGGV